MRIQTNNLLVVLLLLLVISSCRKNNDILPDDTDLPYNPSKDHIVVAKKEIGRLGLRQSTTSTGPIPNPMQRHKRAS